MRVTTGFDPETCSRWVLHLEISAQDMLAGKFDKLDRAVIESSDSHNSVSHVLMVAALMAQCIEAGISTAVKE